MRHNQIGEQHYHGDAYAYQHGASPSPDDRNRMSLGARTARAKLG